MPIPNRCFPRFSRQGSIAPSDNLSNIFHLLKEPCGRAARLFYSFLQTVDSVRKSAADFSLSEKLKTGIFKQRFGRYGGGIFEFEKVYLISLSWRRVRAPPLGEIVRHRVEFSVCGKELNLWRVQSVGAMPVLAALLKSLIDSLSCCALSVLTSVTSRPRSSRARTLSGRCSCRLSAQMRLLPR